MKYGKIKKYYYENTKYHEIFEIIREIGFIPTSENLPKELIKKGYTAMFKNENDEKYYIFWELKNEGLLYEIKMKEIII